jgi:hypothetical protein
MVLLHPMSEKFPRSPYDAVRGLVYFPRMLDKARLHAAGELPEVYHKHLGVDFDGRCLKLLGVSYEAVRERLRVGDSDEKILEWCYEHGRGPTEEEVEIWSAFMSKRGWRDEARPRIDFRLEEAGLSDQKSRVATMFDFIDIDEGRTPPDFTAWEPPRV